MSDASAVRGWRSKYCWVICIASVMLLFLTIGLGASSFSIYHPFVLKEYGFTDSQGSLITTMRWLFSFLSLFVVDRYLKKFNLRWGIALACLCSTAAFFIYAATTSFYAYCFASMLTGIGHGLGTMIPVSLLVNRWFANRRAFAIGICATGSSLADIVYPPALTALIGRYGVESTFWIEAFFMLALSAVIFLLVRNDPADIGAQPYFSQKVDKQRIKSIHIDPRRSDWVLLYIAMVCLGTLSGPGFGHLPVLFTSQGYDSMAIAQGIMLSGVILFATKFVYGLITDRMGTIRSNVLFGAVAIIGQTLCCFAWTGSPAVLFCGYLGMGMGFSLTTVGISVWAADFSSEADYARNLKRLRIGLSLGSFAFSPVPGMMADAFGSYLPTYNMFAAFSVIAVVFVQCVYLRGRARSRKLAAHPG